MSAFVKAGISTVVGWIAYVAVKKFTLEVLDYSFPEVKKAA